MSFDIDRVAFSIFGIDIYWYAIIIICGILLAAQFAKKEFTRRGFDEDFIYDIVDENVIIAKLVDCKSRA